jgi:hypothetical protein
MLELSQGPLGERLGRESRDGESLTDGFMLGLHT